MCQKGFNLCKNCSVLYYTPTGVAAGYCPNPASATHQPQYPGKDEYNLERLPSDGAKDGWCYCDVCKCIWNAGSGNVPLTPTAPPWLCPPHDPAVTGGHCPHGGTHTDNGYSADYYLWKGGSAWMTCKDCKSVYNVKIGTTNYCVVNGADGHHSNSALLSIHNPNS